MSSTWISLMLLTRILLVYTFTLSYAAGLCSARQASYYRVASQLYPQEVSWKRTHTHTISLTSSMEKEMHLEWRHGRGTDRPWNKLVHAHRRAASVSPEAWLCHSTPFHSQVRSIARVWTLTSFSGYSRVTSQSKQTPSAPHFVQFNFPFFSLEVWLCCCSELTTAGFGVRLWRTQLIHSGACRVFVLLL